MTAQSTCNAYDELLNRYEEYIKKKCLQDPKFRKHLIDICVGLADNPIGEIAKQRSIDITLFWQCDILWKTSLAVSRKLKIPHNSTIIKRRRRGQRIVANHMIQTDPLWCEEYEKIMAQED